LPFVDEPNWPKDEPDGPVSGEKLALEKLGIEGGEGELGVGRVNVGALTGAPPGDEPLGGRISSASLVS
jgi:hypothetical protein